MSDKLPELKPYWDFDCEYTDATEDEIKKELMLTYGSLHVNFLQFTKYKLALAQRLKDIFEDELEEECQYDHHGYCQTHFGDEEADEKGVFLCKKKKLLKLIKELEGK